jgi:hypothetical protein
VRSGLMRLPSQCFAADTKTGIANPEQGLKFLTAHERPV